MKTDTMTVLRAEGVTRVFGAGAASVTACADVSLSLEPGKLLVVRGRSGSGKTTLLNVLGALDRPTSGRVWLRDAELTAMSEDALVDIRRKQLGFVFQTFGLIPALSAAENIEVPLRLAGMDATARAHRVTELLDLVGLTKHARQRPAELSGGQQQRVGIARAIAREPAVLLADEPTGQLDTATGALMLKLITELVHSKGIAAVVTTHDPSLMEVADTIIELRDGRTV
jgi:putative ABC transport system ATP-binding protein